MTRADTGRPDVQCASRQFSLFLVARSRVLPSPCFGSGRPESRSGHCGSHCERGEALQVRHVQGAGLLRRCTLRHDAATSCGTGARPMRRRKHWSRQRRSSNDGCTPALDLPFSFFPFPFSLIAHVPAFALDPPSCLRRDAQHRAGTVRPDRLSAHRRRSLSAGRVSAGLGGHGTARRQSGHRRHQRDRRDRVRSMPFPASTSWPRPPSPGCRR